MNRSSMVSFLQSAGLTANSWFSDKRLVTLMLESDGNQYHDFLSQMIYFDTVNDVIKIKDYTGSMVSSQFAEIEKTSDYTFSIKPDIFGYYGLTRTEIVKPFRNPEVGDIFFLVNSNNAIEVATITEKVGNTITIDEDLDLTGKIACYASGKVLQILAGAISPKKSGDIIESFLGETTLIWYKRAMTGNIADVYLSFFNIEGFDFRKTNVLLEK
jgi:hypothetical protein